MGSSDSKKWPKDWKEYSFDVKALCVYHLCMMVMFIAGGVLSVKLELATAGSLLVVAAFLSAAHRKKTGWRWQGIGLRNVMWAIAAILVVGPFMFSAAPLFPPTNPRCLPWHLAIFGMMLFGVLSSLEIIYPSESEFLKDCGERKSDRGEQEETAVPQEARWKKTVWSCYSVLCIAVWLSFSFFFYKFGVAYRDGAPAPTAEKSERLLNRGGVPWVTAEEKKEVDALKGFIFVAVPMVILLGVFLGFAVGRNGHQRRQISSEMG